MQNVGSRSSSFLIYFISIVSQLCFLLIFWPHKLYSQNRTQTDPCKMISDNSTALTSNGHFIHSAPASWPPYYHPSPQEHFYLRDSTLTKKKIPSTFRFLPKYYLPNVTYPDSTIFLFSASFSRVIFI